jgi:diguanylate cyclase (GGDEF)-like protein
LVESQDQISEIEALRVHCAALEQDIAHLKKHDQLTGLLYRAPFTGMVDEVLAKAKASNKLSAMIDLGVRGLPQLNGLFGRHANDYAVSALSARLNQDPPPGSLSCRLDYWCFAVFLTEVEDALQAMSIAKQIIEKLSEPVDLVDRKINLEISAGVALSGQGGDDATSLLSSAALAQKLASERGGNSYSFFNPALALATRRKNEIHAALSEAIQRQQFKLHFQPYFNIADGALAGFEALLRFDHPELGSVSPAEFIPVAEESGAIIRIGAWALAEACRIASTWPSHMTVSVNISPEQFYSGTLLSDIHNALELSSFPAYRLEVEITESTLLKDSEVVLQQLTALREMGCPIALDDFGTGYSSLSYMWKFPFSKLKIDRAFVQAAETTPMAKGMLRSIIELGKNVGLKVTSEGVETQAQAEIVRQFKCDQLQGYLCGKPVPEQEIAAIILRNFSDQLRKPTTTALEKVVPLQSAG